MASDVSADQAPVPPPSYHRTVATALHLDALTLVRRLQLRALRQLAVQLAQQQCPPPLSAGPGGAPRIYQEESLVLLALLRTLWRLSYQELHGWLCAWPALALARGLPLGADGRPRVPSKAQESNRLRAAGAPASEMLFVLLVRQGLTAMENERLRREREEALRQTTAQMETFLGVSGHELRNPLTSMRLGLQTVEKRIRRLLRSERVEGTDVALLLAPVAKAERQEERLNRLVNDLVDVTRVRAGKMELNLVSTDLATIVREAVEEQRQVNPEHTIVLEFPPELRVPVQADPQRGGNGRLFPALLFQLPGASPPAVAPVELGGCGLAHPASVSYIYPPMQTSVKSPTSRRRAPSLLFVHA
jgi:signal transduction histidine kinase